MSFANIRRWQADVNRQGNLTRTAIRDVTGIAANHVANSIRARVPPGASNTGGMAHPFPGYAATGALRDAITAGPVVVTGNAFHSLVAVRGGSFVQMYAQVHEYGKVITARRAPYLVFRIGDRWIRTKQVRIRPKRFFEAGWNAGIRELPELVHRALVARAR